MIERRQSSAEMSEKAASGELMLVTLLGDDPAPGADVAERLRDAGHEVHAMGVKAPAIAANHALAQAPDAVVVYVARITARRAVQTMVAHLQHRGAEIPVLLHGPGVDGEFARWVAVPQGGTPYWGGVYYCEDEAEALQVLKQIVLFTPPPQAHSHDHGKASDACDLPDDGAGGACSGCPISGDCDQG
jgi:methylmalonyl-CoA mutase cobalamin-binding subunit